MANLRIRELDNVSVGGDNGTSADAVYIVVDPASGGTGKVSLESAVAGTDVIANAASALGAPLIWSGGPTGGRAGHGGYGDSIVKNNIFALGTTVFGTISWGSPDPRSGQGGGASETATISKSKGVDLVFAQSHDHGIIGASRTIMSGTPGGNELLNMPNNNRFDLGTQGRTDGISLDLEAHTNGLKFRFSQSSAKLTWNLMYWPTS